MVQLFVLASNMQVGFCVHVLPVTEVTTEHFVKQLCVVVSHMHVESAEHMLWETYFPLQETEQVEPDASHAQRPEDSHEAASWVATQDWMHLLEAPFHMQLGSALQAPLALYMRPHCSVQLCPFHWQVVSAAH